MGKIMKVLGLGCAGVIGLAFIALVIIGTEGPETSIYTGTQIPKKYMTTIQSLNLLQPEEQIRYFYSDALVDIKDGFYFVSDKNLVLYSSEWAEPSVIIPFGQIESVTAEYSDSEWIDTSVLVTLRSEMEYLFPLSTEKGLDKKFIEVIENNIATEVEDEEDSEEPVKAETI
ncbi:MAG: hypothetical protein JXQ25_07215 [Deltaproteobacteria bacterium]|nr:hypothetical protein [Deltaproteobacteria bacterium]